MQQVIAAVSGSRSGYFTLIFSHKPERTPHQFHDVFRLQVTAHEQVVAREAAHRTPIDDAVFPLRVVAQIGRSKMFHGVDSPIVEDWFAVGFFHADVESGHGFAAHPVFTAHVDAAQQPLVVNGE